jgi:acyl carrier protein
MDKNDASEIDRLTDSDIREWMTGYIARLRGIEKSRIGGATRFEDLGLDSMMVIIMTEEMGNWLGRAIEPTAAYDHPTIGDFARFVAAA